MPTFSLSDIAKVIAKIAIFAGLILWINSKTPILMGYLNTAKNSAFDGLNTMTGLDFGCISNMVGIDVLFNGVLNSIAIASTFYLSAISTILIIKYSLKLVSIAMKV